MKTPMTSRLAVVLGLLAGAGTYAQSTARPGAPGHGLAPYPPASRCAASSTIVVPVQQYFQQNSTLHLRQILDLDRDCRGARLHQVFLIASTRAGRGQAAVAVNGRTATRAEIVDEGNVSLVSFDMDPRFNMIGHDINTLELDMRGQFYVESVGVVLEVDPWGAPNPGPRPGPAPGPAPGPGPRPGPGPNPGPGPRPGPGPGPHGR